MNHYPTGELGLGELMKRSVRLHYLSLKYSIFCILLITLSKFLASTLSSFLTTPYIKWPLYFVSCLVISFFYFAALFATHRALSDKPLPIKFAVAALWSRRLPV